ncbi:hypothetical protein KEM48_003652 [Puccinia striiformis f. sp. tritici PST-130]|nr:hypothetical protein KEM48_003652 [Puccinia striiformis f. sp. tritici PST-130]
MEAVPSSPLNSCYKLLRGLSFKAAAPSVITSVSCFDLAWVSRSSGPGDCTSRDSHDSGAREADGFLNNVEDPLGEADGGSTAALVKAEAIESIGADCLERLPSLIHHSSLTLKQTHINQPTATTLINHLINPNNLDQLTMKCLFFVACFLAVLHSALAVPTVAPRAEVTNEAATKGQSDQKCLVYGCGAYGYAGYA